MTKQKILIISEKFWPEGGGAELATYLIAKMFSKIFDTTVVTGTYIPRPIGSARIVVLPFLRGPKIVLWKKILLYKNIFFKLFEKYGEVIYIPRYSFPLIPLAKKLKKRVIVHLHDYIPISYTATVLAPYELMKKQTEQMNRYVECNKGIKHCTGYLTSKWFMGEIRKLISMADRIICVSNRHKQIIANAIPKVSGKIAVIYNPIPKYPYLQRMKKVLQEPNSEPTFVYLGGDDVLKGYEVLLLVLLKILKKYDIEIHLFKTSNRSRKTINMINKYLGKNKIVAHKREPHHIVFKFLLRSWGLIHPSIIEEPLPYAVIDACIARRLIIASEVGGVPELFNKKYTSKFLYNPFDTEKLVEILETILTYNPKDIVELGTEVYNVFLSKVSNSIIFDRMTKIVSGSLARD